MKQPKGAVSTASIIGIVIAILIIAGIVYWYGSYSQNPALQTGADTSSAAPGGSADQASGGSVTTSTSGNKTYSNFKYGYAISIPPNAVNNNFATAEHVTVGFKNASGPDAMLTISTAIDVSHIGYCLVVPQNATQTATTTIQGIKFLSYTVGAQGPNTGTSYYRALQKGPAGNTCYDIQKISQGSAELSTQLNTVLNSFTFIQSS